MLGKNKKKSKAEKKEAYQRAVRKGLLFWLPGGSTRLDVYLDYCILHCLAHTKMEEKSRVIPFNEITKVVYTPATVLRHASLQLFTKDMPNVKRSFWYAYENNLVVVHPSTDELAHKVMEFIQNPNGSNIIPPDYLPELKRERRRELREEAEAKRQQESSEKAGQKSEASTETTKTIETEQKEEA